MKAAFVPNQPRPGQRIAARILAAASRALIATLRFRWNDSSGFFDKAPIGQAIYCFWHNRLAIVISAHASYVRPRKPEARLAALVSASKDGAFLAAILECFGIQPVRGSSSRRGSQALLELTTWAEKGYDLAITPDGPRGPAHVIQEGVISLAALTGLPIIPFSYQPRWRIRLKSWDRFIVPLPFSICEMNLSTPVHVPRESSDAEREALRKQLEQTLLSLSGDE